MWDIDIKNFTVSHSQNKACRLKQTMELRYLPAGVIFQFNLSFEKDFAHCEKNLDTRLEIKKTYSL